MSENAPRKVLVCSSAEAGEVSQAVVARLLTGEAFDLAPPIGGSGWLQREGPGVALQFLNLREHSQLWANYATDFVDVILFVASGAAVEEDGCDALQNSITTLLNIETSNANVVVAEAFNDTNLQDLDSEDFKLDWSSLSERVKIATKINCATGDGFDSLVSNLQNRGESN